MNTLTILYTKNTLVNISKYIIFKKYIFVTDLLPKNKFDPDLKTCMPSYQTNKSTSSAVAPHRTATLCWPFLSQTCSNARTCSRMQGFSGRWGTTYNSSWRRKMRPVPSLFILILPGDDIPGVLPSSRCARSHKCAAIPRKLRRR